MKRARDARQYLCPVSSCFLIELQRWRRKGSGDLPGLQSRPDHSARHRTKTQHSEDRLHLVCFPGFITGITMHDREPKRKANRHHYRHRGCVAGPVGVGQGPPRGQTARVWVQEFWENLNFGPRQIHTSSVTMSARRSASPAFTAASHASRTATILETSESILESGVRLTTTKAIEDANLLASQLVRLQVDSNPS